MRGSTVDEGCLTVRRRRGRMIRTKLWSCQDVFSGKKRVIMCLNDCPITDAELVHLKTLKYLDVLRIGGTRVTEAGIEKLREWLPETSVYY